MKKSFVALAALSALAASGVASAQSSVTLFGILDASISGYSNQSETPLGVTVTKSQTMLANSAYQSSRLGFRGTEDLGGGMAASFWLEAGLNNNNGTGSATGGGLSFNRRSTVSLSNNFGEVRLGRDYTPTYWNDNLFDPFAVNGVGTSLISTASGQTSPGSAASGYANSVYARASNSVGYFLPPNLGGIYGQVMFAFNGNTSYDPGGLTPPGAAAVAANRALAVADNARAGRYVGGRVGYASGPLDVALAAGSGTVASNYYLGTTGTIQTWSLGGSYDFSVVKLFAEYSNNKQKTDFAAVSAASLAFTNPGFNGGLIGVTIPIGAGQIRATYSAVKYNNINTFATLNPDPKADKFAIGYVYNLSKRTALYATYAYLKNKDGAALTVGGPTFYTVPTISGFAAVPNKSQGYDIGIRHAF